ncbi:hypothetical protein [Nocardiopsis tropica]|uniref:Uncharacterized protein n=1 Tax=Nocardiopsis tropica TaxID=109330 RepID=A0ABV1ZMJ0_9ACTN
MLPLLAFPLLIPAVQCLILMSVMFLVSGISSLKRTGRRVEEGASWAEAVEPGPLIHVAAIALLAALVVQLRALMYYGPSFFPEDTCILHANIQAPPSSHDAFPISTVCPYGLDPGGVEIVPAWTNPTIAVLVAAAAVILAAAYAVHRRRT